MYKKETYWYRKLSQAIILSNNLQRGIMFGATEEQISEIDRLVKLNNTIIDISTTTEVEIKIVAKVLVGLNLKTMIEELLKVVKRGDLFVEITVEQKLTFNQIVQYLIYINKNIKTTISKRLSKIEAEVKRDQRKLIRLDIEDLINEMYSIYKLFTKEYEACCESNEFYLNDK